MLAVVTVLDNKVDTAAYYGTVWSHSGGSSVTGTNREVITEDCPALPKKERSNTMSLPFRNSAAKKQKLGIGSICCSKGS